MEAVNPGDLPVEAPAQFDFIVKQQRHGSAFTSPLRHCCARRLDALRL